jgi:hypothetical protein
MTPSPQAIEWSAQIRRCQGVHRQSSPAETKLEQLQLRAFAIEAQEGRLRVKTRNSGVTSAFLP